MAFEWTILSIEVNKQIDSLDNVVVQVYWQYTLKDSSYNVFEIGNTLLLPPHAESFVALNDVTTQTLINWLTQTEDMAELETRLRDKLSRVKQKDTYIIPFVGRPVE